MAILFLRLPDELLDWIEDEAEGQGLKNAQALTNQVLLAYQRYVQRTKPREHIPGDFARDMPS